MQFDPEGPSDPQGGIFGVTVNPDDAAIVLIPVPFDATASYRRKAASGPQAILAASDQLDLFDRQLGMIYKQGIALLPEEPDIVQANAKAQVLADKARTGNQAALQEVNAIGAQINGWLYEQTRALLVQDKIVGVIGGDHSTPFGAIQAQLERTPDMGILHIDAHADLRDAYEGFTWSHASIMFNVINKTAVKKLVQVGIRDFSHGEFERIEASSRIETFFDDDLKEAQFKGVSFQALADRIVAELPQEVYVSFDIDGLDPTLCPNTGTPVPGGLSFPQATALLRTVRESGRRIVGFDLCEVAPGQDEWDGNVGARLIYLLCGLALPEQF
jgi:agmatinase